MQTSNSSAAVTALGLGDMLSDQTKDETEELRKKRQQMAQMASSPGGSLAAMSLLGSGLGKAGG